MQIYLGAALLVIVMILSILLICGLPLGELTMGGRYKVWPPEDARTCSKPIGCSGICIIYHSCGRKNTSRIYIE